MKHIIKKILSIALCYFLVLSLLPLASIVTSAATYGGSGTESDPYIVSSQAQLVSTLSTHNAEEIYIKLNNDISLNDSYVPNVLYANIDGDFHTITAKTQFFTSNRGTLKNFYYTNTVTRVNTRSSYAGIVCDENYGTISGVIATGHIDNDCHHTSSGDNETSTSSRAGIIAGTNSSGKIINCAAFGSISLSCSYGSHAGGITAYGGVTNCYVSVTVSATGSSRYGTSSSNPITLGTSTNSYFEAETGVTGSVSSADMKTDSFVELLNSTPVLTDSKWVKDTQNTNSGYPILQRALNATITPSKTNVLLNGTESVSLTCSDSAATIYYTLDGSTPTLVSNKYLSPISINSTTTLTVVAYKNGVFSTPQCFLFAKILGNGTKQNPYKIDSEAALHAISELGGDDYYILTQNITLNGPVPSLDTFNGHFDGQNYELNNVYSDKAIGGFISTNYGIIENLTLRIKTNNPLTALSGFADFNYGIIYNCHFNGDLHSPKYSAHSVGGIVGENYGRIESSSFDGYFFSRGTQKAGGLVGSNSGAILHCNFEGRINIDDIASFSQGYVGGLVGYNTGEVKYSHITATSVFAYTRSYCGIKIGSLIGDGTFSSVVDCTENVDTVNYSRISYIEWGTCSTNRNVGTSSGNPIPTPHNHDFYLDVDAPVCGQQRHTVCVCDCGISVAVKSWTDDYYSAKHEYVDTVVIESTCTEDGSCTKVCKNCSHTIVETIPATGHKTAIPFFKITNDSKYPFNIDNGTISSTNTASYSTSSLTLEVLQDHTLSFKYYLSSYNSSYKLSIYLNETLFDYTYSSSIRSRNINVVCGDIIKVVFEKNTSSTTANTGYFVITSPIDKKIAFACDETAICEWCNAEITPELVVHTWDDGVFTTEWGCTSNGVELYTCTKCGETKTVNYTATGHHVTVDTSKITVLKNDNTYPFSLSENKYTSTNKAHKSTSKFTITAWYNCTITLNYGVSSESSYDFFTIYKNGVQQDKISGSYTGKTKTLTLTAGDTVEIVYSKDGSTSSGSDSGYFTITSYTVSGIDAEGRVSPENIKANCIGAVVCEDCGEEIKPVLDHAWDNGVVTTQPTHMTEGEKLFSCIECGITRTEAVEKLSAHEWDDGVITTQPTHLTEGLKTFTCPCGETYTETIEKLTEHTYKAEVIAPTCITKGYTYYTCDCGDTYTVETTALGHTYDVWVTEWLPTCEKEGSKYSHCTVCGEAKTELLSPTRHNIVDGRCLSCGIEILTVESNHNYGYSIQEEYLISKDNAIKLLLTFSSDTKTEGHFDTISIYNGNGDLLGKYSGTELASKTITIEGSVVKIILESDDTVNAYGFKADVFVVYPSCEHNNTKWITDVAPTYESNGHKNKCCADCNAIIGEADIPKVICGDTNHDNMVDAEDLVYMYSVILDTAVGDISCDTNNDGTINLLDLVKLKKYLAGLENILGKTESSDTQAVEVLSQPAYLENKYTLN